MGTHTQSNLRIPGPTPLPPEVLESLSAQMISHRGKKYEEIQARVVENLRYFFQTANDIFLLTSSGMGGLEAAVSNFFSPGDKLLYFTCGEFGNRWAEIAVRFGANVIHTQFKPGEGVAVSRVKEILAQNPDAKGVFFTHNETSSGVLNHIEQLAPLVKSHPAKPLLLIDSISALGAVDLPMDKLGIDVLVSASQKAWMAPPGMAFISVSPYAWEKHTTAEMPHYYFDISMYKKFAEKNQTPATPAVTTLFALDTSLGMMRKVGREKIFQRHMDLMDHLRQGVRKIGLELFVEDAFASPTVTSIKVPDGKDAKAWQDMIKIKYNIILAGGMGETKGKIIRVAHMGWVSTIELNDVLTALEESYKDINY